MKSSANVSFEKTARDLIYTTHYVGDTVAVREVKTWFHAQPTIRSIGIVRGDGTLGLITREKFCQCLLESPAAAAPIGEQPGMIASAFSVDAQTPVQEIMQTLLAQRGQEDNFFDDIVVQFEQKFIGLISVRDLVVEQLGMLIHRMTAMEAQQSALARQNKDLFENSFRQGQRETQFRSFFEWAPMPVIIFDRSGRLLAASRRFCTLTDYSPKQLDSTFYFQRLFADDFLEAGKMPETEESVLRVLTLLPCNKSPFNVNTLIEMSPDWGHLIISILGLAEKGILSAPEIVHLTSSKPASRITQAIRVKVEEQHAQGLARSVASNLIDREEQVERLMKKLEKIFEVSEKVEQIQAQAPAAREESPGESQNLNGDLSEFSVVDLCQILVQGTKTGELLLYRPREEQPVAHLFFYCGSIVHAEHQNGATGVAALDPILKIRDGRFHFVFHKSSSQVTIAGDPMGLLMEACRKMDETHGKQ